MIRCKSPFVLYTPDPRLEYTRHVVVTIMHSYGYSSHSTILLAEI